MIFEAYYSKWRLVKFIAVCAAFIAATTYLLGFYGDHKPSNSIRILGLLGELIGISSETLSKSISWVGLSCSIVGLIFFLSCLFHSGPVIKVDRNGIFDISTHKTIRWDNIDDIYNYSVRGQRFIAIKLNDRSIDTPNRRGGLLLSLTKWLGTGDVTIDFSTTNGKYEDFLEACDYWRASGNDRMARYSNLHKQHKIVPGRL